MKTRYIIIIIIAVLLATGIFFAVRKVKDLQKLEVKSVSLKPVLKLNSAVDILKLVTDLASLTIPSKANLTISNFSQSDFNISQIKADIYSVNDVLIANPTNPGKQSITLTKNSDNTLNFDYNLSITGLINASKGIAGDTISEKAQTVLMNYLTTKMFGLKVRIKGFVTASGITVSFDEIIDI